MARIVSTNDQMQLLQTQKELPFDSKTFSANFFFGWVYPILRIGKQKPLIQNDLLSINESNSTQTSYQKFISQYGTNTLKISLFKAFFGQIFISFLCYIIVSILQVCQPIITAESQKFFMYDNPEDKPTFTKMLSFAGIQLLYMLILSLVKPYQLFQQSLLSVQIQGALQQQVLLKTLKFPISRSKHFTNGELINILQVDITQASNYFAYYYILLLFPIQLVCSGLVFYITVGDKALIPTLGALVQTFVGIFFGYCYGLVQKKYMMEKDLRMKGVDEALLYSKQVKLNSLEDFFEERIASQRSKELMYLKYQVIMLIAILFLQQALGTLTWEIFFFTVDSLNFATVAIMMQNYDTIVNILQELPNQLKNFSMSSNSISRIENYFKQNDCLQICQETQDNEISLKISNGSYDWKTNDHMEKDVIEENLENLNQTNVFSLNLDIEVKKGQFIAFVGNSASGKSTILRSILGETNKEYGQIYVNGIVSVATQEPWIINGSIKKNITFMNEFDSTKYKQIIKICGLERDIQSFKYGDETILGEKGDNLSGGQQKRINLARAVYNDADIYLLDDPMSALDIKVKCQINQQCILGYLKNKTRILFTNSMANLQECDMIYIVENGQINRKGKFAELMGILDEKNLEQKDYIDLKFEEQHYTVEEEQKQDVRASLIQEEDQEKGQVSNSVLKSIYNFIGRYWAFICAILYFVIVLFCQLAGNAVMAQDGIPDEEFRRIGIIYYPLIQFPISTAMVLMKSFYLVNGLRTSKMIHSNVINSLLNASYTKFYNTILIGRLMNRLSKDIYNIDLLFPSEIQNLLMQLTTLLLPLFACFLYLNLVALPLLLLFFIVMIYLTIIYYRCLREVTRIESVSKSPVFSFFQQIVRGITYVRACLDPQKIVSTQQKNVDIDLGNQINLSGFQYWYQSLAGTITNTFQCCLFIVCFLFPGKTQKMTNLVLTQMQTVSQLLLNATISYGNLQMYFISFERCLHLANKIPLEDRVNSFLTPQDPQQNQQNQNQDNQNVILKLTDCSFQYRPNSKCVLQKLSLQINKGEKIGVVGRTGAGKSSIILALTSILDQIEGSIEIENKNINYYTLSELRSKYSIIPQDPLIFMGTLKQNLDPLHLFSEAKILEIASQCKLFELQSFRQKGLESEIAISGSNLSSGEKQLLNITRCILENKQIILVDEATANIDSQTEEHIKQIFEICFANSAMLTIAHKVTTIMNSDRIMVLNDGFITEFDHPNKLLENPNSEFKQIIDLIHQSEQL